MKFIKKLKKLFPRTGISIVVSVTLFLSTHSCKYVPKISKNISAYSTILVAEMQINNQSIDIRRDKTKYPLINFVGEKFRISFISNFNRINTNIVLKLVSEISSPAEKTTGSNALPLHSQILLDSQYIFLSNNLNTQQFSLSGMNTILEREKADAFAVCKFTTSIWEQNIQGIVYIYNKELQLIWQQSVQIVSTYIVKDEKSPYKIEYDEIFDTFSKDKSHMSEILVVYDELGKTLAERLTASRNKALGIRKEKSKKVR